MSRRRDRSREAECPLCGGARARHLVTKRGCEVVRCAACRLVFVWPPPGRAELEALYAASAGPAGPAEEERRRCFARRLRAIEALAPERGRILDVGCSKGYFLEAARAAGWHPVGVELNRAAADAARARGLDVRTGEMGDQALDEASFDVVTLFDLLEHTRDPRATLAACHRALRPGGLLVATTPDVGGLVPRLTWLVFGKTLGAWEHPTPPGHLVQFSRRTLRQLLETAGFRIVRERSEHIPIAYSAAKLENSIMDVLAGRHCARQATGDGGQRAAGGRGHALRRLPRYGVRGLSWLVIGLAGLAARATGWGDSRWVAARRG